MPKSDDLLPQRRGRRLVLFNPHALISIGKVMTLMRDKQLTETVKGLRVSQQKRSTRWLTALELLEQRGLQNGLDPDTLASHLGISTTAARRAMNRAEFVIFDVFGLHVTFFQRNEKWRLLNHVEATRKYARTVKDLSTRSKRARLYLNVSRYHGTEQEEDLRVPLFRFDFSPEALPNETQN